MTFRNQLIGAALRRCRTTGDPRLTLDQAAGILGRDKSRLSRIETGARGIRPWELQALLAGYGTPPGTAAALTAIITASRQQGGTYLPSAWASLLGLVRAASRITSYEAGQIPFLAQDPAYTEAAAEADPTITSLARTDLADAIPATQRAVWRDGGPDVRLIIGEAVLDRLDPAQAGGLRMVRDRAEIRVLPRSPSPRPVPWAASITLLEFDPAARFGPAAFIGGPCGGVFLADHGPAAAALRRLFAEAVPWVPVRGRQAPEDPGLEP